ncbi:MAG TPA: hypothetical protein VFL83_07895 [Anaeromyxobacter sp.]|nr:hypothetical protein [Anaeromyxobacter sp.]
MAPLALAIHLALASTGALAAPPAATSPPAAARPDAGSSPRSADAGSPPRSAGVAAAAPDAAAPSAAPGRFRAIGLAPRRLDPGPFRAGEIAGAALGVFAGDAAVLGSGYLALQLFATGTIRPTATNFRRAVYGLGVAALVVPPLTAVLVARLMGGPAAPGGYWKALLLASLGQAAALAVGYLAAPHLWIVLPVQAIAVSVGASYGLHWGGGRRRAVEPTGPEPDEGTAPADPPGTATAALGVPTCAGG